MNEMTREALAELKSALAALNSGQIARSDFLARCAVSMSDDDAPPQELLTAAQELSSQKVAKLQEGPSLSLPPGSVDITEGYQGSEAPSTGGPVTTDTDASLAQPADQTTDFTPASGKSTTARTRVPNTEYVVGDVHARGGFGKVWMAQDTALGRQVALKGLRSSHRNREQVRARFIKEAMITGQLEHPNIVPVYHLGVRAGQDPFYTMRFISGRTLTEEIARFHAEANSNDRQLHLRRLIQTLISVGNAISYAHSRRVIHRDLKGQNVVLGGFGEVVVLDWGVARLLDEQETPGDDTVVDLQQTKGDTSTVEGEVIGTPAFMAPEQAMGQADRVDERTDVYGLGAILYQILTGKAPFSGKTLSEIVGRDVTMNVN